MTVSNIKPNLPAKFLLSSILNFDQSNYSSLTEHKFPGF
ncbi:hypothetical protein J538_2025 [Acinetobacter sp. 272263]|nr:hypothetical protein J538_2025 [Acinetobacter sp. 272263]